MAYNRPTDLDGFIALMGKVDMRVRPLLAEDLVNFLSDSENDLTCMDLGMLIDGLQPWLTGSHFKVSVSSPHFLLPHAHSPPFHSNIN